MNDDLSDIANALTGSLPRNGEAGMLGQFKSVDGNVLLPGFAFTNDLNTGIYRPADDQLAIAVGGVQVALFTSGGLQGSLPIGAVIDFAGSTVPSLFILCYGQNVSRVTYASLFAIIGTTYGSGDGVTTFGLPDLRGRTIFGRDDMGSVAASRLTTAFFGSSPIVLGNVGGTQSFSLATTNLPAYTPAGTNGTSAVTAGFSTLSFPVTNGAVGNTNATGGGPKSVPDTTTSWSSTTTLTGTAAAQTWTGTAQGGLATAFSLVDPAIILNKIIYAGA